VSDGYRKNRVAAWMCGAVLLAVLTPACGPIAATQSIARADNLVDEAGAQYAEQYAPYQYLSAVEYLAKAREEWGYSDFQQAHRYAQRALAQARAAIDRVRNRTDALGNPLPPAGTAAPGVPAPAAPAQPAPSQPAPAPAGGDVFRPVNP
jgi:hypothetical protein